jgi:hypothetical protein
MPHTVPEVAARRRSCSDIAFELLAAADAGTTDALLLAKGFTIDQMVGLVRAGLAGKALAPPIAPTRANVPETATWPCQSSVPKPTRVTIPVPTGVALPPPSGIVLPPPPGVAELASRFTPSQVSVLRS